VIVRAKDCCFLKLASKETHFKDNKLHVYPFEWLVSHGREIKDMHLGISFASSRGSRRSKKNKKKEERVVKNNKLLLCFFLVKCRIILLKIPCFL
jgi:hypothetical protein